MAASQSSYVEDQRPNSVVDEDLTVCTDFLSSSSRHLPNDSQVTVGFDSCPSSPKRLPEYDFFHRQRESLDVANTDIDCTLSLGVSVTREGHRTEVATRHSRSGSPLHKTQSTLAVSTVSAKLERFKDCKLARVAGNETIFQTAAQLSSINSHRNSLPDQIEARAWTETYPARTMHHWTDTTLSGIKDELSLQSSIQKEETKRCSPCAALPRNAVSFRMQHREQEATSTALKDKILGVGITEDLKLDPISRADCTKVGNVWEVRSRDMASLTYKDASNRSWHRHFLSPQASIASSESFGPEVRLVECSGSAHLRACSAGQSSSSSEKTAVGYIWRGIHSGPRSVVRICTQCKTMKTPLWRNGPHGPKSLCNACGIRFKKEAKRAAGYSKSLPGSPHASNILFYHGFSPSITKEDRPIRDDTDYIVEQHCPFYAQEAGDMPWGYQEVGKHSGKRLKMMDERARISSCTSSAKIELQQQQQQSLTNLAWRQASVSSGSLSSDLGFHQLPFRPPDLNFCVSKDSPTIREPTDCKGFSFLREKIIDLAKNVDEEEGFVL